MLNRRALTSLSTARENLTRPLLMTPLLVTLVMALLVIWLGFVIVGVCHQGALRDGPPVPEAIIRQPALL
jgi:hypothetical protein